MKKKGDPTQQLASLVADMVKSFAQWNHINEYGCSDPGYSDGINMNLVSNHVIYYKRQIAELCEAHGFQLPDEYHMETPPEVAYDYMARPVEIREKAKANLLTLQSDPAIIELKSLVHNMLAGKAEVVDYVLRSVRALDEAIEQDDLVALRRYGNVSYELNRARELVASISDKDLNPQLSLFSFLDDGEPRPKPRRPPSSKKPKQYER